jgi:hypothetical protein
VAADPGNPSFVRARNDADHNRHIPARLFDMLGKSVVIVIDGMLVNCSVRVPMRNDVTVFPTVWMAESKADVVVTRISGRRFRRGNEYALERERHSGRHHERDGDALDEWSPRDGQRAGSSMQSA